MFEQGLGDLGLWTLDLGPWTLVFTEKFIFLWFYTFFRMACESWIWSVGLSYLENVDIPQSEVASVGVLADLVRGLGRVGRRFRLRDLFLWTYSYGPYSYKTNAFPPIPMAYTVKPMLFHIFLWPTL